MRVNNASAWGGQAEAVVARDAGVTDFRGRCVASRCGTNVLAAKLWHFLQCGQVVPAFEFVRATAGEGEALLRDTTDWGRRRLAVEQAIDALHGVVYATVDLDHAIGDSRYGRFRLVIDPSKDLRAPIVLPHNSASAYVTDDGVLKEHALCDDAAGWPQRADVLTVRRGAEASRSGPAEWPRIVCSEDPPGGPIEADVVEVVLRSGVRPMTSVEAIRIAQDDWNAYAEAFALALLGAGAPTGDVAAFNAVVDLVNEGRLDLEVIG